MRHDFFFLGALCDFQKDFCSFIQDTTDNLNWTRNKGSTPTPGTGPQVDHTLGSRAGKCDAKGPITD